MKTEIYYCPRCQRQRTEDQTMMFTVFGPWRRRCTRCGSSVSICDAPEPVAVPAGGDPLSGVSTFDQ